MVMGIWEIARTAVNTVFHLKKKTDNASPDDQDTLKDPAAGKLVPPVAWGSLLVLSIILTCLVMKLKVSIHISGTR
jgi:hypothetical protein